MLPSTLVLLAAGCAEDPSGEAIERVHEAVGAIATTRPLSDLLDTQGSTTTFVPPALGDSNFQAVFLVAEPGADLPDLVCINVDDTCPGALDRLARPLPERLRRPLLRALGASPPARLGQPFPNDP